MFRISKTANKKYDVFVDGKWIPFGDKRYEHYRTSPAIPAALHIYPEHRDLHRKASYLARASRIRDGEGHLTATDPHSANYWAINYLWT